MSRRFFLAAFGDPGHAFPMLALGARLVERGHVVLYETWDRWRPHVEAAGMEFTPAPEYPVFPTRDRPLRPYQAVVAAAGETGPRLEAFAPDAVVADILTLAPALCAERLGVPRATLIPHVYPSTVGEDGIPPYSLGARLPRTGLGRSLWTPVTRWTEAGVRQGRSELNETRRRLGLPPVTRLHGGMSDRLVMVGTFPQLEYPRTWPPGTHVVGPLLWEPPYDWVEPPPGDAPLVLIAPSTAQDPSHRLLRAALGGLGSSDARVLATWNRRPLAAPARVPANTRLVEWVSYSRTMPRCALVVTHAGHGTVVRALASGAAVVAVPAVGDMNENAARVDWAGVGVRLPWRLLGARTLRWTIERALASPALGARARSLADWAAVNDGATRAAELVEQLVPAEPQLEAPPRSRT